MAPTEERPRDEGPRSTANDASAEVGFPSFAHDPFTFEGEIERLGAFASGARRASRGKRVIATLIAMAVILPFFLGAVLWLIRLVTR